MAQKENRKRLNQGGICFRWVEKLCKVRACLCPRELVQVSNVSLLETVSP